MAPVAPPAMNVLQAWPLFTAFDTTGYPLIGGLLHTYAANTSIPKASFADPFLLVENMNPVVLDAMGQAMVYLDGFYRLVLTDREGIQLWEVDNYEWEVGSTVPPSGIVTGADEDTVTTPSGEGVIQVPNLVPLGYRVEGVIVRIGVGLGTSLGLQSVQIGDAILQDRWGSIGLTAGLTTGQRDFRGADRPIAATAYTILLAAIGGRFDSVGEISVKAFWSSIGGWV